MTMSSLSMHLASLCIRSLTTPRRCCLRRCLLTRGQWGCSVAPPAPRDLEGSRPHWPPPLLPPPPLAAPNCTTRHPRTSPKACYSVPRSSQRGPCLQPRPLPHKCRPSKRRPPATSSPSFSIPGSSPRHTSPPPPGLRRSAPSAACPRPMLPHTRRRSQSPHNHPRARPKEALLLSCPSRGAPPHWPSASSRSLRSLIRCTWMMVSGTSNSISCIIRHH